jgi:uncharacterized protein YecT (DUF1311 family)
MRLLILSLLLSMGLAVPQAPTPAPAQKSAEHQDCSAATTTAAMRSCEIARYARAERELRAVYSELSGKSDVAARSKLAASQSAWEQFRIANADFHADTARDGTMAPLLRNTALAEMTEARVAELKQMLH